MVLVVAPDGMAMAAQDADRWGRRRPDSAGVMPATLSPLPDRKGGFTHTQPSQANLTESY